MDKLNDSQVSVYYVDRDPLRNEVAKLERNKKIVDKILKKSSPTIIMFQQLTQLKIKNNKLYEETNNLDNLNLNNNFPEDNNDKEILESLTNNIEFIEREKDLMSNNSKRRRKNKIFYLNIFNIILINFI